MSGLEFHLAWSLFQLLGALALWVVWVVAGFVYAKGLTAKWKCVAAGLGLMVVLAAAFDSGARQSELGRSNFNSSPQELPAKVEVQEPSYWRELADMKQRREEIKSQQEGK